MKIRLAIGSLVCVQALVLVSAQGKTTADGVYRWSISVLSHLRGAELATHVANTQLQGAGQVTATDVIAAPLLRGREGEDVFRGLSDVA